MVPSVPHDPQLPDAAEKAPGGKGDVLAKGGPRGWEAEAPPGWRLEAGTGRGAAVAPARPGRHRLGQESPASPGSGFPAA